MLSQFGSSVCVFKLKYIHSYPILTTYPDLTVVRWPQDQKIPPTLYRKELLKQMYLGPELSERLSQLGSSVWVFKLGRREFGRLQNIFWSEEVTNKKGLIKKSSIHPSCDESPSICLPWSRLWRRCPGMGFHRPWSALQVESFIDWCWDFMGTKYLVSDLLW